MVSELTEAQRYHIIDLLENGEDVPSKYKYLLFPPERQEYELVYASKESEEDILAETMAVPLQPIRTFGSNNFDWNNILIFGDNLQAMKTLLKLKEQGGLVNADGSQGSRLIYIDPPFGTGKEYQGNQGERGYSAKIKGARFMEFMRRRLVLLREIMHPEGLIFVRQAYNWGHYIKVILDEVFEQNFVNEIIINRKRETAGSRNKLDVVNESIFLYSRSANFELKKIQTKRPLTDIKWTSFLMAEERFPRERRFLGLVITPPKGQHFSLVQEKCDKLVNENYIRLRCRKCSARLYYGESEQAFARKIKEPREKFKFYDLTAGTVYHVVTEVNACPSCGAIDFAVDYLGSEDVTINTNWLDIPSYTDTTGYPTENSEVLLSRIIACASNEGDLVIDAFAGSGTTLAVAEKMNRRWIGIDCGKLSIYCIQKRMLNLKSEIGNKGKSIKVRTFTLFNAGLYDFSRLRNLPWESWRFFALNLFQCRDEPHKVGGIDLDGYRGSADVLVFNHTIKGGVVLDYGFVDDLNAQIGSKLGSRFFIIAPAASVTFLEDYIDKGSTRYYILRIPYSVINELHNRDFEAIKQPADEMQVNETVEAVGFDFIRQPKVECEFFVSRDPNKLFAEAVVKIKIFKSEAMAKGASQKENLETLSMVLVDYDYPYDPTRQGKELPPPFEFDTVFYASDLHKADWEIKMPLEVLGTHIMLIYIDIYGNEYAEIKSRSDFVPLETE